MGTAIAGGDVLGILPTGTGKSVCYQLPALARFHKTGALTVVISPLVALMADQVDGLRRHGISSAVAINGLLSLPERHEALDRVRLGDAAMLLISPEQLRNSSVRAILRQREIGYWVIDEAHCLSKWGQDFRPDYRYIGRFIREFGGDAPAAPMICLTATAKPSVLRDILDHFRTRLGVELELIDGGAFRDNLAFEVVETGKDRKNADILSLLKEGLPPGDVSGAIVYCSTRGGAEKVAEFLVASGMDADHFHAGLKPERKKEVQERFRDGGLRVIAATNAFGMGIDKPDIRLVIHADIPGSLENYVQEAGRAGSDRMPARCVLLFCGEDTERQFMLSARSRLEQREISAILRALRRLEQRSKRDGEIVATPGEVIKEELDRDFVRDTATDDTRVKTAVSWLEEASLLLREENRVQVYPSSLKVPDLEAAGKRLREASITGAYRKQLLDLVRRLIEADADEGISTDDLSGACGLTGRRLRKAMADLEALGIASNDTAITMFLHLGVPNGSRQRLAAACDLERDLIGRLRELAPDLEARERALLNLKLASQELRDAGHASVRPDIVERLIRGLARDGRDDGEGLGSLAIRKTDREHLSVMLQRPWDALARTAEIRRAGAARLLEFLTGRADKAARGNDIQVETTLGALTSALAGDLEIAPHVKDVTRLLDRALLWLHEQEVLTLGKGLTVFRPAITVKLEPGRRKFTQADYEPLRMHYDEKTLQIHIMAEYARQGLELDRQGPAAGAGLFHAGARELHRPLAGGPKRGAAAADLARVMAGHRRGPARSGPDADRRRRPGDDQRARAGRPRLGQDPGPRAPHRLSHPGPPREPAGHPRAGLQPARRPRDPQQAGPASRRRRARRDGAHLPRAGDADGRGELRAPHGASRFRPLRRGHARGGLAVERRRPHPRGGRGPARDAARGIPLDSRRRVSGRRAGGIRAHRRRGGPVARGPRQPPQPHGGRGRRPEHLFLHRRVRGVHPPLRGGVFGARQPSDRELPLDGEHHPRRQSRDRAGRRADEGGA